MMNRAFCWILLLCCFTPLPAQYVFQSTYLAADEVTFADLAAGLDGGLLAGGTLVRTGQDDLPLLVKTDGTEQLAWAWAYEGSGTARLNSVSGTTDGGYVACGDYDSTANASNTDGFIMKTGADGSIQWFRQLGTTEAEGLDRVVQMPDGRYLAVGTYTLSANGQTYVWILRLTSGGTLTDSWLYFPASQTQAKAIIAHPDGGYIVGGLSDANGFPDALLFHIDDNGGIVWGNTYGDLAGSETIYDMRLLSNEEILFVGTRSGSPRTGFMMKLENTGNVIWSRDFGATEDVWFNRVAQGPSGGSYIGGLTQGLGTTPLPAPFLALSDANGGLTWLQTSPRSAPSAPVGMRVLTGNDIAMSCSYSPAGGGSGGFLTRSDIQGTNCNYTQAPLPAIAKTWVKTSVPSSFANGPFVNSLVNISLVNPGILPGADCGDCDSTVASFSLQANDLNLSIQNMSQFAETYFWDFGDGDTTSSPNPSHTYAADGTYTVCLRTTNVCSADSLCQTIVAVGRPDPQGALRIHVAPQPASDQVHLRLDRALRGSALLEVRDLQGQVVMQTQMRGQEASLSVGDLPAGFYLLRMEAEGRHFAGHLVLVR